MAECTCERAGASEIEIETEIEEDGARGPKDLDLGLDLGDQALRANEIETEAEIEGNSRFAAGMVDKHMAIHAEP